MNRIDLLTVNTIRTLAADAVEKIVGQLSTDETFAKAGQSQKEDLIFRRAIVELAN